MDFHLVSFYDQQLKPFDTQPKNIHIIHMNNFKQGYEMNTFFIQHLKGVGQYAVKSVVFECRIDLLRTYLFVGRGILTRY